MEAKPRPLLGSLLGLLLGIVVVALLWQLGVVPPDQLVLFGVLAVTIFTVTSILTQRVELVRKRFIVVTVLCGLMAGVAVAGIPDMIAGGSISDGCFAEGTSSLGSKTPHNTSLADPFVMTRTDSVAWTGESVDVFTDWKSSTGIDVGGFPVEIWGGSSANEDHKQSNSGVEDVAGRLADIEESTGIALAGIYHVYGNLDANEGGCDMSAYVRLPSEGAFTGTMNLSLWGSLAVLLVVILIMAGVVRHSITRAAFAGASTSGAATAAAADPPPTENRAKESAPRAESGRETKPDSRRPEPKAKDKPERAWRQEPGRDEPATGAASGEQMGAEGQYPMPGGDEVIEPPAEGDVLGDAEEPGASSPADAPDAPDVPDAPPSGDDKPQV